MELVPAWLARHRFSYSPEQPDPALTDDLRTRLAQFRVDDPEVSIVVPAYNEEKKILNLLSSLAGQQTRYRTELIIANNNSRDQTQALLDACGVRSVLVTQQGIGFARQAGLEAAKGRYVVNADCDCMYPPGWLDALVKPLANPAIVCTYGTYSFLPSAVNPRWALLLHETAASVVFAWRRWKGWECVNVMGFNFAFRRQDALEVGGFNTNFKRGFTNDNNDEASEDGWMAMTLQAKGKLKRVTHNARVWSSDRLLVKDGGVLRAFSKRVQKELRQLRLSLRPTSL
ncbi:glycosyltransferase family A protein [Nibrella saemangeumensis]|uniref:Glycosyltransferase family A protein n=1 Tax=Nibrella saemangeumensis TaxID=1084526 RepID=A0ABP8MGU5_9BACT